MKYIYIITGLGLLVLFIILAINSVNKAQLKSLQDDLLDADKPLIDESFAERIDPKPQGIHSTAYPNGNVEIHKPPLQPLKQSDLEY